MELEKGRVWTSPGKKNERIPKRHGGKEIQASPGEAQILAAKEGL